MGSDTPYEPSPDSTTLKLKVASTPLPEAPVLGPGPGILIIMTVDFPASESVVT